MKLRLPTSDKRFITTISAYVPTMTCTDKIKEQFHYVDLDIVLRDTPATDNFVILGDFNATVGRDEELWRGVIGEHGVGKMNTV